MQMLVLCLGLLGCASGHVNVSRDQRAIYGADSRREHSDMSSFWQNIGDATVNIGNENDWTLDSRGRVVSFRAQRLSRICVRRHVCSQLRAFILQLQTIRSNRLTLAEYTGCPSQRFANQVLGGGCSGTLIAPVSSRAKNIDICRSPFCFFLIQNKIATAAHCVE